MILDGPLHLRFDATTHPNATDRIAAWRDAMSLSVDVEFRPEDVQGFEGSLEFHPLGTVLLVEARCTPHTMLRDRRTIARSGDAHVILDVFPEGGFSGSVGGQPLVIGAGDCLVLDLKGTLHARMQDTRFIGAIIPRKLLAAHVHGKPAHGLRLAATTPEARLLGSVLEGFVAQAPHLTAVRAVALGLSLVSMIAAVIGGQKLPSIERASTRKTSTAAEPSLARVNRYIARHASDPTLNPDRLCTVFGLSRAALYRMLQPAGGVATMIRNRRAAIGRHLLSDAGNLYGSLDEIAKASGFANAGSLRRALLDIYEASPSQLRATLAEELDDVPAGHSFRIGALLDAGNPEEEPGSGEPPLPTIP